MIICPKCKREVPNGTQYCPFCAEELPQIKQTTQQFTQESNQTQQGFIPPQEIIREIIGIQDVIGVIGWIIMIVGFFAALILGDNTGHSYEFAWGPFWLCFISSIITGILFLCIKKHLNNQKAIIESQKETNQLLKKILDESESEQ